jgi:hypothetical protein
LRACPHLSLSEERSARAEGERQERCSARRRSCARLFVVESPKVVLLSGGGTGISELSLDESALCDVWRCTSPGDTAPRLSPTSPRTRGG